MAGGKERVSMPSLNNIALRSVRALPTNCPKLPAFVMCPGSRPYQVESTILPPSSAGHRVIDNPVVTRSLNSVRSGWQAKENGRGMKQVGCKRELSKFLSAKMDCA
ncbi:hypothetical protein MIR68_000229 [Amoeboaphelidium protococcarum]|nr:hypothetical protein MIR68_000229 [Amoeboaphelidium protococcarum]